MIFLEPFPFIKAHPFEKLEGPDHISGAISMGALCENYQYLAMTGVSGKRIAPTS